MQSEATDNDIATRGPTVAWLSFAVGGFFGLRDTFTMVLVRGLDFPPHSGAMLRLAIELSLLVLAGVDLLRPLPPCITSAGLPSSIKRWVILYIAFAGLSLFWSSAASVPASFIYWSGTACDVGIILLLLRRADPQQVCTSTLKGFVFSACIVALMAWFMQAQYDLRLGDEDYLNANTIANLCAFGFFFAQCLRRIDGNSWKAVQLLLAVTLLRSLSKSTIAAFAISTASLLIQDRSVTRRTKLVLTSAAFILVMLFWGLFEAYYDIYTSTGNQAQTLTGRTAIWVYVLNALAEHPWIGHGFDSMWKTIPAFGAFEARHAENEILQQLYAYGLAGAVMLAGIYGSFYQYARRLGKHPLRLVLCNIVLFILIRGLAEAEPFDLLLPLWAIVVLTGLAFSVQPPALANSELAIRTPPDSLSPAFRPDCIIP